MSKQQQEEANPTTESKKNKIEWHNYFPIASAFLILFGVTRLIYFYLYFNVHIISYLEFSEIITSFFDILLISFYLIFYSFLQQIFSNLYQDIKTYSRDFNTWVSQDKFHKRLPIYIKLFYPYFFSSIILLFVFDNLFFLLTEIHLLFLIIGIFISLTFIIVKSEIERPHYIFSLNGAYLDGEMFPKLKKYFHFVFNFLLSILVLITFVTKQVSHIKNDNSTYGTRITLDNDSTLISDSTTYYVGKTQNYVFIFHEKEKSTQVIPMTRVKEMFVH